MTRQHKPI